MELFLKAVILMVKIPFIIQNNSSLNIRYHLEKEN